MESFESGRLDACDIGRMFAIHETERKTQRAATLWADVVAGRSQIVHHFSHAGRCVGVFTATAAAQADRHALRPRERLLLARVLAGESQKAIAIDFGLSQASVASILGECAQRLAGTRGVASLPLVMILLGQASTSRERVVWTSRNPLEAAQHLVSLPRPDAGRLDGLTAAESDVLGHVIEGRSRREIADLRHAQLRTVFNQLAAARRKLRAGNRIEIVRKLSAISCS